MQAQRLYLPLECPGWGYPGGKQTIIISCCDSALIRLFRSTEREMTMTIQYGCLYALLSKSQT